MVQCFTMWCCLHASHLSLALQQLLVDELEGVAGVRHDLQGRGEGLELGSTAALT